MAGMTFASYLALSISLTAFTVSYAFQSRVQFYPAVIYLVTSKPSVLVLGNMGLMLTLLVGRTLKTIFFGRLRDVEVELLYDNARYAVTETCLALTIFREELTVRVLTLFTALLFSKSFHWLCQSRVEYVESDNVSRWTHFRLMALMYTLLVVDVAFVAGCVYFWKGPSVLILFGFEYTILAVSVSSTLLRYCLHLVDMRIEGNWPQKGSYLFFLEFATEVVRFLSYVVFFSIIFTYYGMPLHIVRDLWMSYVNLKRRLVIFNKYRHLTANMNERFPDATSEELIGCEHTCIICRDLMEAGPGAKKLPCSHIFHLDCLRLWLQQQQSCPTCRADIPTNSPTPVRSGPPAAAVVADAGAAVGEERERLAEAGDDMAAPRDQAPAGPQETPNASLRGPSHPSSSQWGATNTRGYAGVPTRPTRWPASLPDGAALPSNFPHPPASNRGSITNPPASSPHPPITSNIAGQAAHYPPYPVPTPSLSSTWPYVPQPPPFIPPSALFGMFPTDASALSGDTSLLMGNMDYPAPPFALYRVSSPNGVQVRASLESTSAILRTHRQNETILILERKAAQAGSEVVYRVLGGGFIHDRLESENSRAALEKILSPFPFSSGLFPSTPSSLLPFPSPASMTSSTGIGGAGGLSRSLISLRLELNEARAGMDTVVEGLAVLLARQQAEALRLQNVLAGLEHAHEELAARTATATNGPDKEGADAESKKESGFGMEESKFTGENGADFRTAPTAE